MPPATKRPNFVFILTDQQRRDSLGCYGNPIIQTPALDAMAKEGMVFERAFTANVICSPSRASIITGRYPSAHGLITNGMQLDDNRETTLTQVLAAADYRTASVGKIHLAPVCDTDPAYAPAGSNYQSPEGLSYWQAGKKLPFPYYGYQQVRLADWHGLAKQDYYNDLMTRDPKLPELLNEENALVRPTGAPASWKSAIPEEHHSSTWVADESIKLLEQFAAGNDPFYLTVGIPDPHFPYCPPAPWCDMYDPACVPLPRRHPDEYQNGSSQYRMQIDNFTRMLGYNPMTMPEAYVREIIAHTYGMVSLLDKQVGRIMAALKRLGLANNTIVIFTTDHGEHLGDHHLIYKAVAFDELMCLPLIWWAPNRFARPGRHDGIVSHIDLMPTILDLAGLDCPHGVQGRSYRCALETGRDSGRDFAYIEDEGDDKSYSRTVVTRRYSLTYYLPEGEGDLYDLERDPNEFFNRWHDLDYAATRREMTELLLRGCIQALDPKSERYAAC